MSESGSSSSRQGALDTWPFWAPSHEAGVEAALDLAGVGDGTRVCDLGCGDGQVLLAAARRGAVVSGIEADADLVDEARSNLAGHGIDAGIRLGDLFDPSIELDADVFFAYLAPATLQRLLPTLQAHRGASLVTDGAGSLLAAPSLRRGMGLLNMAAGSLSWSMLFLYAAAWAQEGLASAPVAGTELSHSIRFCRSMITCRSSRIMHTK